MRLASCVFSIFLLVSCAAADTYIRQPGVDVLHYDISLSVEDGSGSISGRTKILVKVRQDNVKGMWLDFAGPAIQRLLVRGTERPYRHEEGRVIVDFGKTYSPGELVEIEIAYRGIPEKGFLIGKNRHGRRTIFTDNWPDSAHYWFPCVDHPSDKATVDISVTSPAKYEVVANGHLARTVSLPDGNRLTQWTQEQPIPTYSIAIGIAEFSVTYHRAADGVPLAWYAFPEDAEIADTKFKRTALALSCFSEMIGPYPYDKLAQVESTIPLGAMENASAIFYGADVFDDRHVSDEPVPHEIAHQWFGNSVTPADWDHLWLSEGFATYFDVLFEEQVKGPEWTKPAMSALARKVTGYRSARSAPIIDPGQADLMRKLNPLNYEKGAWVLHMLRGMLGDKVFFQGIRQFYRQYAGTNALSDDFRKVMESVSGRSLDRFFTQWLHQPGWPELETVWRPNKLSGGLDLEIRQLQTTGHYELVIDVAVRIEGQQEEVRRTLALTQAAQTFHIPVSGRPVSVEVDPDGWILKSID